jgi:(p)ppGpp synthase/HD superfamily hydrolase
MLNHGQGVTVHLHDCPELRRKRSHRERWVDVEWAAPDERMFGVPVRVEVKNGRGVLAAVAAGIAKAGSNIENVGMEEARAGVYTALLFTLQVTGRKHLAQVMRHLRTLPEVTHMTREKGSLR